MADRGDIDAELGAFPTEQKAALKRLLEKFLKMRVGHPSGEVRDASQNIGRGFVHGTTASVAGDEFTVAHALGEVPYGAMPFLRLDAVGSSLPTLTVSRAADDKRIYLTSTDEDAPFTLLLD